MNTIAVATLIKGGQQLYTVSQIRKLYLAGERALIDFCRRNGVLHIDEYRMDGTKVANIVTGTIH